MVKLPGKAALILGLIAGALVALNVTTFQPGPPWQTGINIALIAISALGISTLSGAAWRAAIHLTQQETAIVTAVLAFFQLWQQSEPLSTALHAVIGAILAFAAAVGFGPNTVQVVATERDARLRH